MVSIGGIDMIIIMNPKCGDEQINKVVNIVEGNVLEILEY